ncbi:MAG TPA: hypothetical protein VFX12_02770 [Vicinamibacterales bacterium]|nr:hypothetical protein [Vicinamibacterales bacterium]
MLPWVLRLVLVLVVARTIWRLIEGVAAGLSAPASEPRPVGLVRDPVCGTFVVPSRALSAGAGAEQHFFCSERCRQAWGVR